MASSNTSLPLELEDMIIQQLSGNKDALRSCALVSRTWSVFSQRALFRNAQVNLVTYERMTKLLDDLTSIPHLQTLIRDVCLQQRRRIDDTPAPDYMSCLTSVLSLLPNLMKVDFRSGLGENRDTRSYLELILNVSRNAPLVELHIDVYSVDTFQSVFESLMGTNVKQVSLSGFADDHTVDSGAPRKRLHLPSLEIIRFRVDGLHEEFYNCLTHYFGLPNLKECEISIAHVDVLVHWQNILLRGFPPLELFKLGFYGGIADEFGYSSTLLEDAFRPLPLAGLPFQHVHLSMWSGDLDEARTFIMWWSSTFFALSKSKATIHFTQLTFAFTNSDIRDIDTLGDAWNSLDKSLVHTTFSSVRSIHFKGIDWKYELATQAAHPVLEDRMRLLLPRLANRGVLSFD